MDIIFNDEDYYDELLGDIDYWCETNGVPEDKVILGVKKDNVDGLDYYVITVNESIFGYLMWRELDMTERYGREGWNQWLESHYKCMTA